IPAPIGTPLSVKLLVMVPKFSTEPLTVPPLTIWMAPVWLAVILPFTVLMMSPLIVASLMTKPFPLGPVLLIVPLLVIVPAVPDTDMGVALVLVLVIVPLLVTAPTVPMILNPTALAVLRVIVCPVAFVIEPLRVEPRSTRMPESFVVIEPLLRILPVIFEPA